MTKRTCVGSAAGLALLLAAGPQPSAAQTASDGEVTFARDIAPILQRSCQKCHRPGSVAPMSLITYQEVRPWARSMKNRTALRDQPGVMPPWYIESDIGIQSFKDDPSLSEEEIAKIAHWADNGAPEGDPADMPAPRAFIDVDEWEIGEPDLIVSSPSFDVPARAPDWWGNIGSVPLGLTEDRYVAAMEYKERATADGPSTRSNTVGGLFVVHHAIPIVVDEDGDLVGSWPVHEVGRNADQFEADAGRLLKAGSTLVFPSVHTHSNGTDTTARLEVGFKLHPGGLRTDQGNPVHLLRQRAGHRHPRHGRRPAARRLLHAAGEHAGEPVRTPHARSRRADVPGSDLGRDDAHIELRRLRPQLGAGLQLYGPMRRHCCPRAPSCTWSATSTIRRRTATSPTPATGRALATGRSTTCSSI